MEGLLPKARIVPLAGITSGAGYGTPVEEIRPGCPVNQILQMIVVHLEKAFQSACRFHDSSCKGPGVFLFLLGSGILTGQDTAVNNRPVVQAVRRGHLHQGAHLSAAAGFPQDSHIFRISPKGGDIVPNPFQGRYDIFHARNTGGLIFGTIIGQVKEAVDIETVIQGNLDDIAVAAHIFPVVAFQFQTGSGCKSAAVKPHDHRPFRIGIQLLCPAVQILTVFIRKPVALREGEISHRGMLRPCGTDMTVILGVHDTLPGFNRLRQPEAFCPGIGDPAKGIDSVDSVASDPAGPGLNHRVRFTAQKILNTFVIHRRFLHSFVNTSIIAFEFQKYNYML